MIRLRQVALVADDLEATLGQLHTELGLDVCFRDPGVGEFGLHNGLMTIGDQFLEVVAPTREGTTAGRLLEKRGGDGGYMTIFEVDDLDARVSHLTGQGVRIVWSGDLPDIRGRHLHPSDVGSTLVSIDEPVPAGSWRWAGPAWQPTGGSVVSAIAGVTVTSQDPAATAARWSALGLAHSVRFAHCGERGPGLDEVDVVAVDRDRAGESVSLAGVTFRFV